MVSVVGLKFCAITTGFTKKGQKHNKRVWLAKAKLKSTYILISRTLIDFYISHGEFDSMRNVLKENDDKKDVIKRS